MKGKSAAVKKDSQSKRDITKLIISVTITPITFIGLVFCIFFNDIFDIFMSPKICSQYLLLLPWILMYHYTVTSSDMMQQ